MSDRPLDLRGGREEEADQDGHAGHRHRAPAAGRAILRPEDDAHIQVRVIALSGGIIGSVHVRTRSCWNFFVL